MLHRSWPWLPHITVGSGETPVPTAATAFVVELDSHQTGRKKKKSFHFKPCAIPSVAGDRLLKVTPRRRCATPREMLFTKQDEPTHRWYEAWDRGCQPDVGVMAHKRRNELAFFPKFKSLNTQLVCLSWSVSSKHSMHSVTTWKWRRIMVFYKPPLHEREPLSSG